MKNTLLATLLTIWLASPILSTAQNSHSLENDAVSKNAPWVSSKGYWVSESNVKHPDSIRIFFYNNQHQLIYHETIVDNKINFKKRKTLMKMRAALESALDNWEELQKVEKDRKIVAKTLGLKLNDF